MRSLVGLGLAAACAACAACAAKPPEPLEPANARAPRSPGATERFPVPEHNTSAPRPDFDIAGLVPDFHDLLRWPLTAMSHPTLEPHFAIAPVFADPGVDWIELCNRGAQNRSLGGRYTDEMQYLRAWCHVLQHDVDTALGELAPLRHSSVRGMPEAVHIDIANVIVDGGDAEKAEHWLSRHDINDADTLDTLTASYVEVGRETDAWQINTRLLGMSRTEPDDLKCRRITKQIVLGPQGGQAEPLAVLQSAATKPKIPDATCVELFHAVRCWRNPANDCSSYLNAQKLEYRYARILWLWYRWPTYEVSYQTWLTVANQAWEGIPIAGAEKALLVALDAAERTQAPCPDEMMNIIAGAIRDALASTETVNVLKGFRDRCAKSQREAALRAEDERRAAEELTARAAADAAGTAAAERLTAPRPKERKLQTKSVCGLAGLCAAP